MADKAIQELIAADQITPTDMFVLEQNGTAKKLMGQILLNWLTAAADGHGGIKLIEKTGSQGLVDTYTITLADTTTSQFTVTNGKYMQSFAKTGTAGLEDTYTILLNDGTRYLFTVTNGAKGDKGDNAYVHIKWASKEPTASSHSFGDVQDNWMGVYSGNSETAPTDWQKYKWLEVKGDKGDTGEAASLQNQEMRYQVSNSGTVIPSGNWESGIPSGNPGQYLWSRTTLTFNTGSPVVIYNVSKYGNTGEKGDKGDTGRGFQILDYYDSLSLLQSSVTNPRPGDAYGIGTAEPYDIYIWSATKGWVNNGQLQGAQGPIGPAAELMGQEVVYQVAGSGTVVPTGEWQQALPAVAGGQYLWTRTTLSFNTGSPVVSYSVSYSGKNGETGATGPAGSDGYTPVKGTDYWTQADQQSIVQDVLVALPTWTGGSY